MVAGGHQSPGERRVHLDEQAGEGDLHELGGAAAGQRGRIRALHRHEGGLHVG